jgi:outer membrane protein OmpA-like peptidoglycan-associated protein
LRKKLLFTLLILLLQTACAVNLKSLINKESQLRSRNDFNAYLAREYLQYSRKLANQYDWRDSDYFAKKGLRAANNHEVYPEVAQSWDINSSKIEEISIARNRLQLLLNEQVKYRFPIQLAHMSLLFDCWISAEGKPWSIADLSRCKTRFLILTTEIEESMAKAQVEKKKMANVEIIEIKEPEFQKFEIYFDFNSYKFNSGANQEFFDLLDHLESLNGDFRILLAGNADRRGKTIYNASLARKRVLASKKMLIKNGVPADLIEIKSFGETKPKIVTKDNKRNRYNRVVSVYVLKGDDSISTIPLPLIDNYIYKKEIENMKKNKGLL